MSLPDISPNPSAPPPPDPPVKLRSTRYGDLQEHELIHLLDSVYDERSRARFRESIYISMFVWIAVAWFLFYGPQVLFHSPRLVDPSTMLRRQHEEEIARLSLPPSLLRARPRPAAKPPTLDSKTLAKLRAETPPAPAPAPPPTPSTQPAVLPPVATPPPTPAPQPPRAPQPAAVPDAPTPMTAFNNPTSAGDAIRSATSAASRGGFSGTPTGPSSPGRPGLGAGLKIVSDTQGVNFDDYLRRLHDIIQHTWEPLLPESINPPISEQGITGVDFKIMANGDLGGISIITPSGERALDRAAWGSITSAGKFPPLPKQFHGPLLELHCGYYVNEKLPDE